MIDWVKSQISQTAAADRVDPALALAVASIESGFDVNAIGDTGTAYASYGAFQERLVVGRGGLTTPDTDPAHQAHRFDLDVLAYLSAGGSGSPGQIAAAVQRPGDPQGYAAKVDAVYSTFIGGANDPHGTPTPKPNPYFPNPGSLLPTIPLPGSGTPIIDVPAAIGNALGPAVESLKSGAVKLAIAATVVGVVALLAFGGLKETLD